MAGGCVAEKGADFADFFGRAAQSRTPLVVGFALTHRCSFQCLHCYLGSQQEIRKQQQKELDTATVQRIIDEIVEAGCLFLTLTGGDPMIRRDFIEIYEYAVQQGLLVSVFCNGSLITEQIIASFKKYPPRNVEVSVYGATREIFAGITLVDNGFELFTRGLNLLRDASIRFRLKTVVMTLNVDEFAMIRQMAADYGVPFYHDCSLIPCLANPDNNGLANSAAGCRPLSAPMEFRLPPEQAAEIDSFTGELTEVLQKMLAQGSNATAPDNHLYHCSAGQTGFHIDAHGGMYPCLLSSHIRYELATGSVREGWTRLKDFREQRAGADFPCLSCQHRAVCSGCPSAFQLSTGREEQVDPYYCTCAEQRFNKATA
jgi:radical SAM protein with 4Fe4S-binding SPASM domain